MGACSTKTSSENISVGGDQNCLGYEDREARIYPSDVLWQLALGNKRYVESKASGKGLAKKDRPLIEFLHDDNLKPVKVKGIIIADAWSLTPVDGIFDLWPGEFQVVKICGYTCQPTCGVMGSVEFATVQFQPKVVMVLGNSSSDPIKRAVSCAMRAAGRKDALKCEPLAVDYRDEDMIHVHALLPAAQDALLQSPSASVDQLVISAGKLTVWRTIETLLKSSRTISDMVASGSIELHGAFFNVDTGKVQFMGQHPSLPALLNQRPPEDVVRTASDPPVPAEEALAKLYAGSNRYVAGKAGQLKVNDELLVQLSQGGQNPISVIIGCADSRAPIEIIFDVRPGDVFVLRNAGNTCASGTGTLVGSAEYAVSHLRTKLIVVAAHTKCGAVTAAVDSVRKGTPAHAFTGSIGAVLEGIRDCAVQAIEQLPDADIAKQVELATKLNAFSTIAKLIKFSDLIRERIQIEDLEIHGAVYDIFTGRIQWLGQHPELEKLAGRSLPVHKWKVGGYISQPPLSFKKGNSKGAVPALACLSEGNQRFMSSALQASRRGTAPDPFAVVIAGLEIRVPIEQIFDVQPGSLIVHRVMGSIGGRSGGTLLTSVEYAVARYSPKLLLVLVDNSSPIVKIALEQVTGAGTYSSSPLRFVLDRVMVSAMRAIAQVSTQESQTEAGQAIKAKQLCVELNALYTIEQLCKSSIIKDFALKHGLELHAAVLDAGSGRVDFIGQHPMAADLLNRVAETVYSEHSASRG